MSRGWLREIGLAGAVNVVVDWWERATRDGRTRRFTRRLFGPGDLVFDVGANLGARTALYLELGARVVAVEPVEECLAHLRERFGEHSDLTIVARAVGECEGTARIRFNPDAMNMASLSEEWIAAMRDSGRVEGAGEWTESREVGVTTLDALIAEHGVPAFCKIDVEGYEEQVLAGLSQPLPLLSFEFTPERPDAALACLDRLDVLAAYGYNYSLSERAQMVFRRWQDGGDFRRFLRERAVGTGVYGDVYARLRAV